MRKEAPNRRRGAAAEARGRRIGAPPPLRLEFMKHVVLIARLLLGGSFLFFGLNVFYGFLEPPAEMPPRAAAFLQALTDTEFMHPLRGAAEIAGGAMVLTGVFLPLGLLILAPVVVHIVLYHQYLDPSGTALPWALLGLGLFLAYAYASSFRGVLDASPKPRWTGPRKMFD